MRRIRKVSFEELVSENKKKLLSDKEELKRIEERIEKNHIKK